MSRLLKWILALNLAVITVLVFAFPHLMVAPGKLIPGHQKLEANCFACHTALTGASSEKCISCHKPSDIGRFSTTGAKLAKPLTRSPFHQELQSQDCMACHSDHSGVRKFHAKGSFDHALLKKETAALCENCHRSPKDALHQQIAGNCSQCHAKDRWKPASFDHEKYFLLDKDHNTTCVTCHPRSDYKTYTCYGCHEHTPEKIRREHVEEGIRDFKNCVECHRSASGEGGNDD